MANYYEAAGDKVAAEAQIRNALVNQELDVAMKVNILSRYILQLQQSQKGLEAADSLFQTLSGQHPEDTELKMLYGSLLQLQGKDDEARFQYQLVAEMEPENTGSWQQLLSLAMKAGDTEEAVRVCLRCMELFPDAAEYYFYLGIAYVQQEKYEEALNTYTAGIGMLPESNAMLKSDFYGQIGDVYYQTGEKEKAYASYDEALKYNERNIPVLNNYSYFLSLDRKNLDEAERMSAITVNMEPDNSTYLDTYAWIFFVQGRFSLAKIYIERAVGGDDSGSAELLDHYGDILYMTGDKEKAVEQWKKAREAGKDDKLLDRKIADETYYDK
jgi:tetratricopeptide (TPR) repeat protein